MPTIVAAPRSLATWREERQCSVQTRRPASGPGPPRHRATLSSPGAAAKQDLARKVLELQSQMLAMHAQLSSMAAATSSNERLQAELVHDHLLRKVREIKHAEAHVERSCEDLQKQHVYNVTEQHELRHKLARAEAA